jgi:hypothetical protein
MRGTMIHHTSFAKYFANEFGRESEVAREVDGLIFYELPTLTWLGQ